MQTVRKEPSCSIMAILKVTRWMPPAVGLRPEKERRAEGQQCQMADAECTEAKAQAHERRKVLRGQEKQISNMDSIPLNQLPNESL